MPENYSLLYEGEEDVKAEEDDLQIEEYDLTSSPNDFNVLTINSFIDSGSIKIPGFQRNYVWDIKRASKLIESIILGLPIPQIFLYEEKKNQFLVIDGQQRLMTIYFYVKGRFPKKEKRTEIRRLFNESNAFPESILYNDEFFSNFNLSLSVKTGAKQNPFNDLNYKTLDNYQMQFDLRPIRCVVVKQNVPKDDNSSVFEIFNRLNSGGINLMPQEIRSSLYHSDFMDMLFRINLNPTWRKLLKSPDPDLHMKDIELLLRGYAMAIYGDNYTSSLAKFLNNFADTARKFDKAYLVYLESFLTSLFLSIDSLPEDIFLNRNSNRFNVFLFEGLVYAMGKTHFEKRTFPSSSIDITKIANLSLDATFQEHSIRATTNKNNVQKRLERAKFFIDN